MQHFEIVKKPSTDNPNRWMFSFADLLSLILTFFILIFSMADPIQLTNQYRKDFNSPVAFQDGSKESQITIASDQNVIDSDYLALIIKDKTRKDDGMKAFQISTSDESLILTTNKTSINDLSIQAIYDSFKPLPCKISVVANSYENSRAIAQKLHDIGLNENLSYFRDKQLGDDVKVIVYPKF